MGAFREAIREDVREELRDQATRHRTAARFYAGSGAAALYGGAAFTAFVLLVLAMALPGWAAALIVAALLLAVAYWLRRAARGESAVPPGRRRD
jgi:Flp pilus assembly protein TadB